MRAADRSFSFRHLFTLVLCERRLFLLGTIAMAIGSGINLLLPGVLRQILDSGFSLFSSTSPWVIGSVIILLFAIQSAGFYFRSFYFNILGQRIAARLRTRLFSVLVAQEVSFFDRQSTSDLVSRLGPDTVLIQDAVSLKLSIFIRYSFQVIVGFILMAFLSLKLTLSILLILPPLMAVSMYLGRKLKACSREQQRALARSSAIADESLAAIRIVKAFNQESFQSSRYLDASDTVLQSAEVRSRISALFASLVSFLMNASIVFVLLYGISLVNDGSLSIGDLTAFMLYGIIVAVSFAFVAGGYSEFVQALGAGERIYEYFGSLTESEEPAAAMNMPAKAHGRIEFQAVSFSYPSRPDAVVLNDVSFAAAERQTLAIVGPSGAGKSTIIALLLGFYRPTTGTITFDGIDISRFDPRDIRRHVALVPQDPQLFALSIADNLRFAKPDATDEELRTACRQANILSFIEALPDAFETLAGERGVLLSGGQKQRLAIARALLRDPAVLILDEATSALDSENEFAIREAIREVMRDRTVIVIAHRLSTIKDAHAVVVLDQGSVVQTGDHDSLSQSPGLYRQLVERQELAV